MDKLLGFVAPVIRATVVPMFNIVGAVLGTAKDGAENIAKLADEKKKVSGVIGLILGWLGIDPQAIGKVGSWLIVVGEFLV